MNFKGLTTQKILDSYNFSDKFLRLFVCACAEYVMNKVKDPDPRSLNAVAVARRYALGEATEQELQSASDDVYAAYASTATYADAAAYTTAFASTASDAAYAAHAYAVASDAAYHAAYYATSYDPTASYEVKAILIKMVDELTELERLML